MFEPMAALAIGWALCGCVGPIRGVDIEVGTTVQRGRDPPRANLFSKGCGPYLDCGPMQGTAPVYGVGLGIVAGAAIDFRIGLLTLRPYAGARYEQYFERDALTGPNVRPQPSDYTIKTYAPTYSLALEAGLGLGMGRIEFRPTIGIGALAVSGNKSVTRVVTLGISLSTRVFKGLIVGTFFHYNLSPYPDLFSWESGYKDQTVDAPIVGLEAAYRFTIL